MPGSHSRPNDDTRFATGLLAVLLAALGLRLLAYTGFFGSDEVTYVESAYKLLDGDWRVDDYVGANRMGVNLPMAGFAALFGRTEAAAAAWSLLCSLAEVGVVAWVGRWMVGTRAALLAALLMATLPVHVHFAGRIMADAPLALLVTLSFALFYVAEQRRSLAVQLLAGVCAGLSFWVKPVTLFIFGVLLLYPLVVRRVEWRWAGYALGMALALAANGLLMWGLTGNFWFVIDAMRARSESGYLEETALAQQSSHAAGLYAQYLFVKIHQTGLLGYLAAAGLAVLVWHRRKAAAGEVSREAVPGSAIPSDAVRYLLLWALGLVLLLSLLVVSLRPLMLIPKQVNYMLLFAAPLCLLGGVALAALPRLWRRVTAATAAALGALLALLLQGSVAVFTANSLGTVQLAATQDDKAYFVMSNAYRAAVFERWVGRTDVTAHVFPMGQAVQRADDGRARWAVVDAQTFSWDGARPFASPDAVPACWQAAGTVQPVYRGVGVPLLRGLAAVADNLPAPVGPALVQRLGQVAEARPARLYLLPAGPGC